MVAVLDTPLSGMACRRPLAIKHFTTGYAVVDQSDVTPSMS